MKPHYANHTVSIQFAHAYLQRARALGLDTEALLADAAIEPGLLSTPAARLTPYQLARLLHRIMVQADDEFMGLTQEQARFGLFTLLAEHLIQCGNLRQALQEAARFYRLTTGSVFLELEESANLTRLRLRLAAPELDPDGTLLELLMLIWHRFPCWLIAEVIPLHGVHRTGPAPAHQPEYRLLFPCHTHFRQPQDCLLLPTYILERPIQQSREQLRTYLAKVPLVWFRKLQFAEQFTEQVRHLLQHSDALQPVTVETIAAQLHTTSRTLRRKLTAEGTQFQSLKDQVRRERALHWLSQNVPVKEVAARAGYTETASFIRAFRHWTGVSPGQYRRQLRSGEGRQS
ncbi:MAG: AraC family transcriptional regulator [Pseudomonadales bacterium]|nr:AraC family transcriptional regulator [Pseudomonadales bacterium]